MVYRLPQLRRGLILGAVLLASGCALPGRGLTPGAVVFFNPFSAALDAPASNTIAQFAADAKAAPSQTVLVSGYADQAGSTDANIKLSSTRAQVVADALVAAGVARNRLVQQPHGSVGGDPGIESRRVELTLTR